MDECCRTTLTRRTGVYMKYNFAIFITVLIIPLWQIAQEAKKKPASGTQPVQDFDWLGCSTFSLAAKNVRDEPPGGKVNYKAPGKNKSITIDRIEATILESWFPSLATNSSKRLESSVWSWSEDHSYIQEMKDEHNYSTGTMETCTKKK